VILSPKDAVHEHVRVLYVMATKEGGPMSLYVGALLFLGCSDRRIFFFA
jgi:hypothetical protein